MEAALTGRLAKAFRAAAALAVRKDFFGNGADLKIAASRTAAVSDEGSSGKLTRGTRSRAALTVSGVGAAKETAQTLKGEEGIAGQGGKGLTAIKKTGKVFEIRVGCGGRVAALTSIFAAAIATTGTAAAAISWPQGVRGEKLTENVSGVRGTGYVSDAYAAAPLTFITRKALRSRAAREGAGEILAPISLKGQARAVIETAFAARTATKGTASLTTQRSKIGGSRNALVTASTYTGAAKGGSEAN